ncbi:MAG: M24 family metallopeptidase [Pseudomonadales bacterium]
MDLSLAERDRRWSAINAVMEAEDLGVVVAHSDYGDCATLQRYISNFRSSYDHMVAMLFSTTECELILAHPGGIPIAKMISWATEGYPMAPSPVDGGKATVAGQMAAQFLKRGIKRIGVAGLELFPSGWKSTIEQAIPGVTFVDVWDQLHHMRLVKSDEEQALIRESARISDLAWERLPEFYQSGRKCCEILADVEQVLRSEGCEDFFNLCMALPMLQYGLDRNPYSALPVNEGVPHLIEVSPRYAGYFAQQTMPVVSGGRIPDDMRAAYQAVNAARARGLEIAKPGTDLIEVGEAVFAQLNKDGFEAPSPSFGHAIGLELEDNHIDGSSLILEEGMTFIFHPFAAGHPAVMRADTYLITATGAERLTTGSTDILELD